MQASHAPGTTPFQIDLRRHLREREEDRDGAKGDTGKSNRGCFHRGESLRC